MDIEPFSKLALWQVGLAIGLLLLAVVVSPASLVYPSEELLVGDEPPVERYGPDDSVTSQASMTVVGNSGYVIPRYTQDESDDGEGVVIRVTPPDEQVSIVTSFDGERDMAYEEVVRNWSDGRYARQVTYGAQDGTFVLLETNDDQHLAEFVASGPTPDDWWNSHDEQSWMVSETRAVYFTSSRRVVTREDVIPFEMSEVREVEDGHRVVSRDKRITSISGEVRTDSSGAIREVTQSWTRLERSGVAADGSQYAAWGRATVRVPLVVRAAAPRAHGEATVRIENESVVPGDSPAWVEQARQRLNASDE